MAPRFEITVSTIEELVAGLAKYYEPGEEVWFRGHSNAGWKLLPSIAREPNRVLAERALIKRFQQNAVPFLTHRPGSEWDWLLLMQHYGAPTRLLDWTESPLVGLYFAVHSAVVSDEADGALWCLSPHRLNKLASIWPDVPEDIPCFDFDDVLNPYLPSVLTLEHTSRLRPAAAMARREFPRLSAQLGVFTVTHRDQEELEGAADGAHLGKIVVPAGAKAGLRTQLNYLRITELTLFPELTSVAALTNRFLL